MYRCRAIINPTTGLLANPGEPAEECQAEFTTGKGAGVHRNSHEPRLCRWCGRAFAINGHTQHEQRCPQRGRQVLPPPGVWTDLLDDLVAHTHDIPPGTVAVMSPADGAAWMTPAAACARVLQPGGATLVVDSALLAAPDTPARSRRIDAAATAMTETEPPPPTVAAPPPRPTPPPVLPASARPPSRRVRRTDRTAGLPGPWQTAL